jgi:hypothetical protein
MAWVIQSISDGPVIISDLNLVLHHGQSRDLDLVGRENAERSNDVKLLLLKGFIKEIRKDVAVLQSSGKVDTQAIVQMAQIVGEAAASAATQANADTVQKLHDKIDAQDQKMNVQSEKSDAVLEKAEAILAEVRNLVEKDPLGIRNLKKTLENIKIERAVIAEKREDLAESSTADVAAHDKILKLKDKKLEKNYQNLGKTVSKSSDDVDETLKAMDELGI